METPFSSCEEARRASIHLGTGKVAVDADKVTWWAIDKDGKHRGREALLAAASDTVPMKVMAEKPKRKRTFAMSGD
jgi:hypothetical protein